jgi:hypothetical protein
METIQSLLATPSWAYDACYVIPIVMSMSILFAVIGIIRMFMLPASVKQMVPFSLVILISILNIAVGVFVSLMSFWICRGALAPGKEKFSNCATEEQKEERPAAAAPVAFDF